MKSFKRINNLTGWVVFAIAATTYLLTIEPTTSFWDCGEFIASSYKLEVGHPPGNPIFQMIGRFFTLFAAKESAAVMMNAMSALCSAFTILFLFWSITHLARRIVERRKGTLSAGNTTAIMCAGAVGALVYTFSDSFWFSAVEAEVYAMSSLFTALVVWAMLRWEEEANERWANRWIVLIAYLMGVSVGVHLLNLLAIPAIALIYYFKKYTVSLWGIVKTLLVSVVLLGFTMQLIPGLPRVAGWFDLLFVNVFRLPFNTGALFFILLLFAACAWGLYQTYRWKKIFWNTALLCFTVFTIGFSSFAMILIRSSANTPTNENQPDNPFALLSYLNRDQYGSAPLFSGQSFATPVVEYDVPKTYAKSNGKYVEINGQTQYVFDDRYTMFLPRMHSMEPHHVNVYKTYMTSPRGGKFVPGTEERTPSFGENLAFLFDYQLGWMYWRYFMWNFAGRQNDIQGHGNSYHGNWECGIPLIDKARLGNIDEMPPALANHKSRNHYYLLPLLLGLCGLFYQLSKDKRNFLVVGVLFVLTGIAIVIYLNQAPYQPRERDYAYAGSFYAFSIWVGLGVLFLYDFFRKAIPALPAAAMAGALCVAVPVQMGAVNWDDHDRSHRYTARDVAYNYFMSCEPNAILFTIGDNDTFPLWYNQEVEGVRTDVRVVNTSLLHSDWYIDQMKRRQYDSPPVPFQLARENYLGVNEQVLIEDRVPSANLKEVMDFVANPRNKRLSNRGDRMAYLPTRTFIIPVNKENVLKNGTVRPEDAEKIPESITISLPKKTNSDRDKFSVTRAELMILDLLAHNDWERPLYFVSQGDNIELGLREYMQYDGFTYRLTPLRNATRDPQSTLDRERLYDRLMHTYRWGNANDSTVWIDYNHTLTFMAILNVRNMYSRTAQAFLVAGEKEKAVALLDRVMEVMPDSAFPYVGSIDQNDQSIMSIIELYYLAGATEKADAIAERFLEEIEANLRFFVNAKSGQDRELLTNLRTIGRAARSPHLRDDLLTKARELSRFYRQYIGLDGAEYDHLL
jgi:hypothetical protein